MRPAALLLAAACLLSAFGHPARAARRPNVLFLFSDDQRADTIAALGNPHIRTPHLDALVRAGTAFERAYCMGARQGAVCVPSRAMLLTGRTLFRSRDNMEGQPTWPEAFAKAGYDTFITGKWHNQAPGLTRVFREGRSVFLGGMGDPYALPLQDFGPQGGLTNRRVSDRHSVTAFADAAVEYLGRRRGDRPFLCYVSFNLPHDPRVAPPEYHAPYRERRPPLPANFLPRHPFNNGEMTVRDEKLAPWPRTPETVREHLGDYYASITFMDAEIGRILAALKTSGAAENTLVVFASDHGLAIGSHGLFGKQNLYEHSMRAPFLLTGPGVPAGRRSAAFAYLLDIFPTLGELAGVAGPEGSEGISLVPAMRSGKGGRPAVFTAYRGFQRAVRDERWKLIAYPHVNKTQLFDLESDPDERRDVAAEPARAGEVRRLTALLREWQERLGDTQALTSERPAPLEIELPPAGEAAARRPFVPTSEYETRSVEGWTVRVNRRLLADPEKLGERALRLLEVKLFDTARAVPERACAELRRVPIWLGVDDGHAPCAEYHPSKDWLVKNGYNPDKARAVEIGNARRFLDWSRDQPAMVLHELAHAYHDRVLGFDHAGIRAAYEAAKASGKYEMVLRRAGKRERAYALSSPQEYFAEASEAFFGTNDFYPFVRAELEEHDPALFRLLAELWNR